MQLVAGNYSVNIQYWKEKVDFEKVLKNCTLGHVLLNSTTYIDHNYTTLLINENASTDCFCIGVVTEISNSNTNIIVDYINLRLAISHDNSVSFFDLKSKTLYSHFTIQSYISDLIELSHVRIYKFFLVVGQFNIAAISFDGVVHWKCNFSDIIQNFELTSQYIRVDLMEDSQPHLIDLQSGNYMIPEAKVHSSRG